MIAFDHVTTHENQSPPTALGRMDTIELDRSNCVPLACTQTQLVPASRAGHILAPSFVNRSILSSAPTNPQAPSG
jgi:hypothetical protein